MKEKVSLVIIVLLLGMKVSLAKPYTPVSNNEVIVEISSSSELKKINEIREQLSQSPDDYNLLDKIITSYLSLGREKSDPRYFGYAQALITPYLERHNLPEKLFIHWADILQHRHDFGSALQVLNKLVKQGSSNAQVYLMRSIIHISRGEYDLALNNCKSLIARASHLLSISCVSQVKSLTGQLQNSFLLLEKTVSVHHKGDIEERLWAFTLLGDMAVRSGELSIAETYYIKGLNLNNKDYYILANYADLLIRQGKYQQVISLLSDYSYVDSLLLRLAIASEKNDDDLSEGYIAKLDSTYRLNARRGEAAHLRDQARFYFEVKHDVKESLMLAKKNSRIQQEPADIKLLLKIVLASGLQDEIDKVLNEVRDVPFEDIELENILMRVGG